MDPGIPNFRDDDQLGRYLRMFQENCGQSLGLEDQRPLSKEPRYEGLIVSDNNIIYPELDGGEDGASANKVFVSGQPIAGEGGYFEVEIIDFVPNDESQCDICVGVGSYRHPLTTMPGNVVGSVGYHAGGRIYKSSRRRSVACGTRYTAGDRIGCLVKPDDDCTDDTDTVRVTFTKNGKEVTTVSLAAGVEDLHPLVCLSNEGDEVRLNLDASPSGLDDVVHMSIDSCEEDWMRLHDVCIRGQLLEYTGSGKSITDVGLAQARYPISTRHHYFEIQIVDPGDNCYIAIGLARKDYPKHRHPGWNRGSIAYHADDGKLFVGSGIGEPFGPECHKGDTMGCGILFPRDYNKQWDVLNDDAGEQQQMFINQLEMIDYAAMMGESESEDEEWWERPNAELGTKVQVFFTRNGNMIGKREVRIPKGGFFPTVGMLSAAEKVHVDLRPLTG